MKEKLWPRIKRFICKVIGHKWAVNPPRWDSVNFGGTKECTRCDRIERNE
jgi:hypothetical protein